MLELIIIGLLIFLLIIRIIYVYVTEKNVDKNVYSEEKIKRIKKRMENRKKILKFLRYAFIVLVILGIIFFIVDYNRVKQQKLPIFCIKTGVAYNGSIDYLGLGYKVAYFNNVNATKPNFEGIFIGSWFTDIDKCKLPLYCEAKETDNLELKKVSSEKFYEKNKINIYFKRN